MQHRRVRICWQGYQMNSTSLVLCKKIKAHCPSAEICEVFTVTKENTNFLIPVFPKSRVTSNGSLQIQSKKGQKWVWKAKGQRGELGWVVHAHKGTLGSKQGTGWVGTACSEPVLPFPIYLLAGTLSASRTGHATVLACPPVPHTTLGGSILLPCRLAVLHQTMKSPFGIPSALDGLVLMAGWPEALSGCPSPGPHGRSFFSALLLPLPDPLALPSPLVASDHKRTVSFNPPA